ncbi:MAG: glycoside hydrolase family 3 protein [Clostridia bacterium]|nr:glycoside hydrolase family 3 protein [Clostridia bacterium]
METEPKRFIAILTAAAVLLLFLAGCIPVEEKEAGPSPSHVSADASAAAAAAEPVQIEPETPGSVSDPAQTLLDHMTLDEKIGQLFMIRPDQLVESISEDSIHDHSTYGVKELDTDLLEVLSRYPAGGFALFGKNIESPEQVRALTAQLAQTGPVPPLIAIDEEGGNVARLANHDGFSLPHVGTMESIGQTKDPANAYAASSQIGSYLCDLGFNMNFAPVADINTNPQNRIIGARAFGSEPGLVTDMVSSYIDGLHDQGILSTVKHFPGHGDTQNDTHAGVVVVHKTWDELLDCELIPFISVLDKTDAVMVAHITVDHVTSDGLPATLSRELLTDHLRSELGYDGLIITDALAMAAIRENYTSAEAAVLAFEAGNDILLLPADYEEAFIGIRDAVQSGRISEERLNESVLRILRVKLSLPGS